MKSRTEARGIALQVLYELDATGHPVGEDLKERIDAADVSKTQLEFIHKIVFGVWPLSAKLDVYISEHAPEWPMDQVAIIDRNIIRIALWEFAVNCETPLKVAINEAVEIAKVYGSESTPGFVNGVLGSLAKCQQEIREALQNSEQEDKNHSL